MKEVCNNLYVGTEASCFHSPKEGWAVIHACKSPCHQKRLNYTGSLSPSHPNYLIFEEENNLYLNIVDMDKILPKYTDPVFGKAIAFIEQNIANKKIIIHCNQGQSRSPAIALVFLAKKELFTKSSYPEAVIAFRKLYPNYQPGICIQNYLINNWQRLVN
ncbi:dual specificity protein phosphatase family protein [Candidatus Woesearchaeota archaeon]|nr:dual specificity protein phosphatase family protein [Candidatus Woesearchaeota archaeon]